jgi:hypothetical protein
VRLADSMGPPRRPFVLQTLDSDCPAYSNMVRVAHSPSPLS